MWLFLFIILIGVGFYVLGAKNGLPKISLIPKSQREKRRYEERIDFLSVLKEGDRITIYEHTDSMCFTYNYKRDYVIKTNDPDSQIISVQRYSHRQPVKLLYDSEFLKDLLEDYMALLQVKVSQAKENK